MSSSETLLAMDAIRLYRPTPFEHEQSAPPQTSVLTYGSATTVSVAVSTADGSAEKIEPTVERFGVPSFEGL